MYGVVDDQSLRACEHGVENIGCILGGDSSVEQTFIDGRSGKV